MRMWIPRCTCALMLSALLTGCQMGGRTMSIAEGPGPVQYLVAAADGQGREGSIVYQLKDEDGVKQLLRIAGSEQALSELLNDADGYQPGDSVSKAKALFRSVIYQSHDAVWNSVRAILD